MSFFSFSHNIHKWQNVTIILNQMKTKLSSFDQMFTVMHTAGLFCHIVNFSMYTPAPTFQNSTTDFSIASKFHFDMSVHVLVISESVHISLMPDSSGCNTGTKYISTLENCANRNPVSAAAKADDTFPILAALTDCLRF